MLGLLVSTKGFLTNLKGTIMCNVLQFEPNASSYNKDRVQKIMAETGKTSYELFGKKSYEKNK